MKRSASIVLAALVIVVVALIVAAVTQRSAIADLRAKEARLDSYCRLMSITLVDIQRDVQRSEAWLGPPRVRDWQALSAQDARALQPCLRDGAETGARLPACAAADTACIARAAANALADFAP